MKTHSFDKQIKEKLQGYNPYQEQANSAKSRIWSEIQVEHYSEKRFVWLKYASVILLILSLPLSFFLGIKYNSNTNIADGNAKRINEITVVKQPIISNNIIAENEVSNKKENKPKVTFTEYIRDTVYIVKSLASNTETDNEILHSKQEIEPIINDDSLKQVLKTSKNDLAVITDSINEKQIDKKLLQGVLNDVDKHDNEIAEYYFNNIDEPNKKKKNRIKLRLKSNSNNQKTTSKPYRVLAKL
jgi:hypothetical protein